MFVLSGARPDADRDPEPGAHRVAAQSHGIQFGESCNLFHNFHSSYSSSVRDEYNII